MNILQGMQIYMRNELKTGENESMQENKMTCLWTGSLQLIKNQGTQSNQSNQCT